MNPCFLCNGRAEANNGVTNCVFLFFIPLIYSFSLLLCHASTSNSHHQHCSTTPPSCFLFPAILWSGRPIAMVMRKVNWPCCVFRRLDRTMAVVRQEVTIFSIFSGWPPAYPLLFSYNLKSYQLRVLFI